MQYSTELHRILYHTMQPAWFDLPFPAQLITRSSCDIWVFFFPPLTNQFSTNSLSLVLSTALIAWKIRTFLDRGLPDWVDQWNRLWGGICAFLTDYLIGCQMLNSMWKDIHNVFSFQNLISRIFNKKKRKKKKLRGTLINWELFLIVKCRCCQNVIRWLE